MNKDLLLKSIAETAYNVGYGAKVNFATLDITEKVPGLLGFIGLAVGVYSLFVPALTANQVGAALIMFSIANLYLAMYQVDRQHYDRAGKELTSQFNELKKLYNTTKSRPDSADFADLISAHDAIQATVVNMSLSKQVLFSDWYAHYKFFWQQQIEWVDEQKNFGLFRDKVPLTAWVAIVIISMVALSYAVRNVRILSSLFS